MALKTDSSAPGGALGPGCRAGFRRRQWHRQSACVVQSLGQREQWLHRSAFCNWTQITHTPANTAPWVTFGGSVGFAAFDNIDLNVVPEPTSAVEVALGIAGLVVSRRRA